MSLGTLPTTFGYSTLSSLSDDWCKNLKDFGSLFAENIYDPACKSGAGAASVTVCTACKNIPRREAHRQAAKYSEPSGNRSSKHHLSCSQLTTCCMTHQRFCVCCVAQLSARCSTADFLQN
jgi:hypothetical protein